MTRPFQMKSIISRLLVRHYLNSLSCFCLSKFLFLRDTSIVSDLQYALPLEQMSGQDMPFKDQAFLLQPKPNPALSKPDLVNTQDTETSEGSSQSRVNRRVREGTDSSHSGHPSGEELFSREMSIP